ARTVEIAKRILLEWRRAAPYAEIGEAGDVPLGEKRLPYAQIVQKALCRGRQGFADAVRRRLAPLDQDDPPRRREMKCCGGPGRPGADHRDVGFDHSRRCRRPPGKRRTFSMPETSTSRSTGGALPRAAALKALNRAFALASFAVSSGMGMCW